MSGTAAGAAKRRATLAAKSAGSVPDPSPRYVVRRPFMHNGQRLSIGTDVTDMVVGWPRIESRVRAGLLDRVG